MFKKGDKYKIGSSAVQALIYTIIKRNMSPFSKEIKDQSKIFDKTNFELLVFQMMFARIPWHVASIQLLPLE